MEPQALPELPQDAVGLNPWAIALLLALSLAMLMASRRGAVNALLAIAAFLPLGQQFEIVGLHIHFFRVLILVGFLRIVTKGEFAGFHLNKIDKLFIAWAVTGAFCAAIRDPATIVGVNCLGGLSNSLGAYFLLRLLVKEPHYLPAYIRFLAVAAIGIAVAMAIESTTLRNPFAAFGGVPELVQIREGRLRCQGPFRHPILAGTFAATLLPLLVGLFLTTRRNRTTLALGIVSCGFVTIAAASSGALLTLVVEVVGLLLWQMRNRMVLVRQAIVLLIVAAALSMKAPVWYLIARVSDVLGGTGWHRSYLIDQAVAHFSEWWLIGTSVTAHWAPSGQVLAVDPNNMDITNHYIAQGIQGGALRLILFIGIITLCFKKIGDSIKLSKNAILTPQLLWALGVALAGHCTAFISISYFDQIEIFWFWLLAVIAGIPTHPAKEARLTKTSTAGTNHGGSSRFQTSTQNS